MKKQKGFSIIMAIFILVVLSLLGSYMVKLSGVQHATSTYAIQGARAYQAAKAGVEWAVARISAGGVCSDVNSASPLSFTDINGFSISLSCTSQSYSEGVANPIVYKITALSEFGVYSSANYISRKIEVSIVN
ncbi:MAG: hypothetical protein KAT04_14590 [Methylococcales bacterium]|nr:hypothetical protein [Methylococcales bacterium]